MKKKDSEKYFLERVIEVVKDCGIKNLEFVLDSEKKQDPEERDKLQIKINHSPSFHINKCGDDGLIIKRDFF